MPEKTSDWSSHVWSCLSNNLDLGLRSYWTRFCGNLVLFTSLDLISRPNIVATPFQPLCATSEFCHTAIPLFFCNNTNFLKEIVVICFFSFCFCLSLMFTTICLLLNNNPLFWNAVLNQHCWYISITFLVNGFLKHTHISAARVPFKAGFSLVFRMPCYQHFINRAKLSCVVFGNPSSTKSDVFLHIV